MTTSTKGRRRLSEIFRRGPMSPSTASPQPEAPAAPSNHLEVPRRKLHRKRSEDYGADHALVFEEFHDEVALKAFAEALRDDDHLAPPPEGVSTATSSTLVGTSTWSRLGLSRFFGKKGGAAKEESEDAKSSSATGKANSNRSSRTASPTSSGFQPGRPRVDRISAASDFAPVREKTHRKRKVDSGSREGLNYTLLRFPLLVVIFLTIAIEFTLYVLTRQLVNVIEFTIAWRGKKGKLRNRLRKARNHTEWKSIALELDEFSNYEKWKSEDASGLYDWILIKKVVASLKGFRQKDDAENLLGVLDLCLRNNFAGTESFRLYSETYYGTKHLIENYLNEVEAAMRYIEQTDKISLEAKRAFYRSASKNMGRSCLCLSGGGSFGYYHLGIVKALVDSDLLPNTVTGTSAGGLIAALTCTRTNDELRELLVPALADRITACEESISVWARRAWQTGARFDAVQWAEKALFFSRGSLTFAEAHKRTGKILNISVIPADRHSPSKLLNYVTAPDCIIWSALLASAAVPGILNPVCLLSKTKKGTVVPWNWGHRFRDGSLRVDIPLKDLHSLFNVNFPLVSQVNPHVHLFFFAPKGMPGRPVAHRKGKGWRGGFVLSAAEHMLKVHLSTNFKIIRDLDLLPSILGTDWSSVFLQPFSGAVTIWPKTRAWDWVRILTDPDRAELKRMIRVGESVTWPKIHMVENRMRLERAIEQGRRTCRHALRALKEDAQGFETGPSSFPNTPFENAAGTPGTPGAWGHSDTDGGAEDYMNVRVPSNIIKPLLQRRVTTAASLNSTDGEEHEQEHEHNHGAESEQSVSEYGYSRSPDRSARHDDDRIAAQLDLPPHALSETGMRSASPVDEDESSELLTAALLSPRHRARTLSLKSGAGADGAQGAGGGNGSNGSGAAQRRHIRDWSARGSMSAWGEDQPREWEESSASSSEGEVQ